MSTSIKLFNLALALAISISLSACGNKLKPTEKASEAPSGAVEGADEGADAGNDKDNPVTNPDDAKKAAENEKALKAQIEAEKKAKATLQTELNTAIAEKDKLIKEKTDLEKTQKEAIANLGIAEEAKKVAIVDLEKEKLKVGEEVKKASDAVASLEKANGDLTQAKKDLGNVQSELDQKKLDLGTAEGNLATANSALTQAKTDADDAKKKLQEIEEQLATLKGELEKIKAEKTDLEGKLAQAQTDLKEIELEKNRLQLVLVYQLRGVDNSEKCIQKAFATDTILKLPDYIKSEHLVTDVSKIQKGVYKIKKARSRLVIIKEESGAKIIKAAMATELRTGKLKSGDSFSTPDVLCQYFGKDPATNKAIDIEALITKKDEDALTKLGSITQETKLFLEISEDSKGTDPSIMQTELTPFEIHPSLFASEAPFTLNLADAIKADKYPDVAKALGYPEGTTVEYIKIYKDDASGDFPAELHILSKITYPDATGVKHQYETYLYFEMKPKPTEIQPET